MKVFLVDPFNQKNLLNNKLRNSPFVYLYESLKDKNIELDTYDKKDLISADKIIFFNHNKKLLNECNKLKIEKSKKILVLWEPETVIPDQYSEDVWSEYGEIVTLREDLQLKYQFPKINWPQGQTVKSNYLKFNERKMITLINANKFSYVEGELYSLRREVITFFEKQKNGDFDLFGIGWGRNPFLRPKIFLYYLLMGFKQGKVLNVIKDFCASFFLSWKTFRGEIPDKYTVLEKYKFNICIENEATYVTEKIFDSLSVGAIPIYKGPIEIQKLVPAECFINYDQFSTIESMYDYLKAMTEEEFTFRQNKISEYMNSEQFKKMQPKSVFTKLAEILAQ